MMWKGRRWRGEWARISNRGLGEPQQNSNSGPTSPQDDLKIRRLIVELKVNQSPSVLGAEISQESHRNNIFLSNCFGSKQSCFKPFGSQTPEKILLWMKYRKVGPKLRVKCVSFMSGYPMRPKKSRIGQKRSM